MECGLITPRSLVLDCAWLKCGMSYIKTGVIHKACRDLFCRTKPAAAGMWLSATASSLESTYMVMPKVKVRIEPI
jgi:hypothetical protein